MGDLNQLLRQYAETGAEDAFRQLVEAHLGLVHSTALRSLNQDAALAADCAQMVFSDLARKARALPANTVLAGWLYRHTRFTAAKLLRGESRRQVREQQATAMNSSQQESSVWNQLEPMLDDALNDLSATDRDAVLLRFFEKQDFRNVAAALEVSESAAQKRVERAIEKLRVFFQRRGVTVSTGALATALAAHGLAAPPASLAAAISAGALSSAAISVPLVQTLLLMSKIKTITVGAVVVAGVATPLLWQHQTISRLRTENAALREQVMPAASAPPAPVLDNARLEGERKELIRLRGEVAQLRREQTKAAELAKRIPAPSQPAPPAPLPQEFVPSAQWSDAGFASPMAALQTAHWAIRNGNIERFKESVLITDDAQKVLHAVLEQMKQGAPPEALAEVEKRGWGAEEGLLFPMIAQDRKHGYTGYRVLSQSSPQPDELLMEVQVEMNSAPPQTQTFRMKQFADSWKRVYDLDALPLPPDVKQKALARAATQ